MLPTNGEAWDDNLVQFARLLCEIKATQDHLDIDELCESMDLAPDDIEALFDRADEVWELAKGQPMADEEFRLDAAQVNATFMTCVADDTTPADNIIEIDMIVGIGRLDRTVVAEHVDLIVNMLHELPTEFQASSRGGGGGWSFLNACMDRHGNQWTGLHRTMAMLFGLGQAIDPPLVTCQLPREMWNLLPGGMPYYGVTR